MLDARANNPGKRSNLPAGYKLGPQFFLEGDFQRYFQLYCVAGEERAVLQVITPDRMALLVDYFRDWDVEIWKNRLYFYRKADISFDGKELPGLFRLLARAQREFVR